MIGKILFIYIVGVSSAVLIDTSENHNKDLVKTNPHGWQTVKVYHPPSPVFGYKYEPYAYPKYEFEYSVSDKKTGDHKHHHEARDGDRVRGEYSLVDSDGSLRKVQYHADDHNGFNAVVSKTVNKHGDHAVSVSDHTRFFYPVGHNVKINHYFPGKDYHYQDVENAEADKISKPVHEEPTVAPVDDAKVVLIESGDKLMAAEPEKIEEQISEMAPKEEPAQKSEEADAVPVQVVNAIVSVISQNSDLSQSNINVDTVKAAPLVEKTEILPAHEMHSSEDEYKGDKEDQADSEVASSYYHSKFYYIGY
ncbi:uncharacterized protein LOC142973267 [Anticarsia gemmatalis]|uniref:uncharacterized protein LOC142973267 n=1 Tax=Anticarsia gemmatalis TaxID=129554 RepID=UPI003F76B94F